MGISDSLAKVFLNNFSYDPSEQTLLVGELANMKGVRDKSVFIVAACSAQQESMAVFMRVMAQLMATTTKGQIQSNAWSRLTNLPLFQKKDGTVVGLFTP